MKFKALFVTFNIVLIVSFLTIFLLPFFILDGAFMRDFWLKNWYFGGIFFGVLAIVNVLFLSQWKMLSCLEREDWPALARYLENRVIARKRFTKRLVRLYCDSLILLGDFAGIKKLSEVLKTGKPALFASFSPRFAAAAILAGDYDRAHALSSGEVAGADAEVAEWRSFYAAFSRYLAKRFDDAADPLAALASTARNPLIAVLSGYLCDTAMSRNCADRASAFAQAADEARLRVGAVFTETRWNRYIDESKADMQIVILGKLITEASRWLFAASNR